MTSGAAPASTGRQMSTWRPPSDALSTAGAGSGGAARLVRARGAAMMAKAQRVAKAIRRMIRPPEAARPGGDTTPADDENVRAALADGVADFSALPTGTCRASHGS